jgi:hypothetical protein
MTSLAAFAFGTLGGVLINVVRLAELGSMPRIERPPTFSDPLWGVQLSCHPSCRWRTCLHLPPRWRDTEAAARNEHRRFGPFNS